MQLAGRIGPVVAAAVLCVLSVAVCGRAQSSWLSADGNPPASVEILKPDTYYEETTFLSTIWFVSGRAPLSGNVSAQAELPVVFFSHSEEFSHHYGSHSETLIGNPYIGVRVDDPGGRWYGAVGLRIPVVPDDKQYAGFYGRRADWDRAEAFASDLLAISGELGAKVYNQAGTSVNLFAGPAFWFPTGDAEGEDTEVFLDYGLQFWVESEAARVGAGLTGRLLVSEDKGGLGDWTIHQFGFAANFGSGTFRPGFHLRVPLDNDLGLGYLGVRYIFGITLSIIEIGG